MTVGPVTEYHQVIIRERFMSLYGEHSDQIHNDQIKSAVITKLDRHDYLIVVEFKDERVHDWMAKARNVMLQFERLGWIPYTVTMKSDVK